MAKKTTNKAKTKAKVSPEAKTSPKPKKKSLATGVVGYRHLPVKKKRFKKKERPKNLKKLPSAFKITKSAYKLVLDNRKLFLGIVLVYGLLNLILVQGLSGNNEITTLKNDLNKGNFGTLNTSLTIFAVLIGSSSSTATTSTSGAYELPLAIIGSLALIWAIRQVMSEKKIRIRDAYYKGMTPLIPFILVLLVIAIQLIPLAIGSALYATILASGIAIGFLENAAFFIIFLLLAAWSIRMVCSSIFALYIVTLPGMTPLKSLRSAKELVRFRRLSIFRKLLFLPIALLIVCGIIMLPIILWLTVLSQWVFFALTMLALLCFHAYVYTIYRELLNE